MKTNFLLDSSAILNNFNFEFKAKERYLMTSLLIAELKDMRSKSLADAGIQKGVLKIVDPRPETFARIMKKAAFYGFNRLSQADLSLLSIGMECRGLGKYCVIVTDDYSIQNFCEILDIDFEPVLHEKIKKPISLRTVCSNCGKEFSNTTKLKKCNICDSSLRKKR
ncbi:MAG: hypothetical protein JW772_00880 [Candidatus Diapherotrites archaeon]|nr:hypothetical protein [Candidatus Diapherotrites archaeon]